MHRTPNPRPHGLPARIAPVLATAGMAVAALVVAGPAPVDAGGRTVVVHPGESIQAAIDAAPPNTTIVVAGGVHAEQLRISTDGITLVGRDTRLVPPPTADPNECTGLVGAVEGVPTEAGICISGTDVTFLPSELVPAPVDTVGRPVRSVRVTGFDIAGFSGPYVAAVGGRDVRVDDNDLTDSQSYGVLSLGSRHSRITDNRIAGPTVLGVIGVCVYDLAPSLVARNDISGQIIGVCVQSDADVRRNSVHDGCVGMYVDPGVGATITHNHVFDNDIDCGLEGYNYGRGVTMAGARGTVLTHNVIEGHVAADGLPAVLVTDDVGTGNVGTGTVATDNVVAHNRIVDNTLDLVSSATGSNRIVHNTCVSSVPADLCD